MYKKRRGHSIFPWNISAVLTCLQLIMSHEIVMSHWLMFCTRGTVWLDSGHLRVQQRTHTHTTSSYCHFKRWAPVPEKSSRVAAPSWRPRPVSMRVLNSVPMGSRGWPTQPSRLVTDVMPLFSSSGLKTQTQTWHLLRQKATRKYFPAVYDKKKKIKSLIYCCCLDQDKGDKTEGWIHQVKKDH